MDAHVLLKFIGDLMLPLLIHSSIPNSAHGMNSQDTGPFNLGKSEQILFGEGIGEGAWKPHSCFYRNGKRKIRCKSFYNHMFRAVGSISTLKFPGSSPVS